MQEASGMPDPDRPSAPEPYRHCALGLPSRPATSADTLSVVAAPDDPSRRLAVVPNEPLLGGLERRGVRVAS
jgi:hypothetical protein